MHSCLTVVLQLRREETPEKPRKRKCCAQYSTIPVTLKGRMRTRPNSHRNISYPLSTLKPAPVHGADQACLDACRFKAEALDPGIWFSRWELWCGVVPRGRHVACLIDAFEGYAAHVLRTGEVGTESTQLSTRSLSHGPDIPRAQTRTGRIVRGGSYGGWVAPVSVLRCGTATTAGRRKRRRICISPSVVRAFPAPRWLYRFARSLQVFFDMTRGLHETEDVAGVATSVFPRDCVKTVYCPLSA
ncbi:uncharacterized protein EI97DRAFT_76037 [Westerdykella ornata]|uniref:Uncharacterized protein n=1 Tax=Westerdykella ornata TaxID=318751 RepID=A0A6A6JHN5_WESOR|nr:uncharacterized protein EI97DRAFT_76037 [Westerdykella ornata]KAF2275468.1 hypothetical protein EI97DRAFT_76037 [Westerdykella ornata]